MAKSRTSSEIIWVDPAKRGIIPLDEFHLSRRDERALRQVKFSIATDRNFAKVVRSCAEREDTWINAEIEEAYCALHKVGLAHSVEVYISEEAEQDEEVLVGGLYGVTLGGAFFGESMFSKTNNASKAALKYLVQRLKKCRYCLLDVQFQTINLLRFGAVELPREEYHILLRHALEQDCRW